MEINALQRSQIETDLLLLKEVQLRIKGNPGWYRRRELRDGAKGRMTWLGFDACLKTIRESRAPEWGYVARGRESAYFLRKLAKALPEKLRPSEEEAASFMRSELRQHVLETIDLALDSYRLAERRGPPEYETRLSVGGTRTLDYELYRRLLADAVDPFVLHLLTLVRKGELSPPPHLVPRAGFQKAGAMAKVKWLLDLRAWLA